MNQALNLIESTLEKVAQKAHPTREQEIKRIIEALLFASGDALPLEKIREVVNTTFPVRSKEIKQCIDLLTQEYRAQKRAFQVDYLAGGYLLRTDPDMRYYIEQLFQDRRGEKLSNAAAEVLAIIAYKGPITRREIEKLRGVDCSGTMASLTQRGLIEGVGRKEAPGRPLQYGVTPMFLQHFGISNAEELQKVLPTYTIYQK